jgi:hypothetical protein
MLPLGQVRKNAVGPVAYTAAAARPHVTAGELNLVGVAMQPNMSIEHFDRPATAGGR